MDLKDYNIAFVRGLPVSGDIVYVQLFNPVSSAKQLVVGRILATAATNAQFQIAIGFTTTDLDGTPDNMFNNRGETYSGPAKCSFKDGTLEQFLAPSEYFGWTALGDQLDYLHRLLSPGQIVLSPGFGITVAHRTANKGLFVQYIWDE